MAASSSRAVSTSARSRPALLAPSFATYLSTALVTVMVRFRSPVLSTTRAVITLVMLPIGRGVVRPWLHNDRPVLSSTRSAPVAWIGGASRIAAYCAPVAPLATGAGAATAGAADNAPAARATTSTVSPGRRYRHGRP